MILLFVASVSFAQRTQKELATILDRQSKCWNNGDLLGFMDDYWKSDSLQFVTRNGVLNGWQTMLDYYRKAYPTVEKMGNLYFDLLSVNELDATHAYLIGRWRVQEKDSKKEGYFSLLFQKINKRWLIVVDHTS